ncbi:hypothetical protein [Bacillus mycoides]|uniref:hypothetical protein n=1 Tax=Bacillus mycoides TaxID=1405 RepID=UPI003A80FEB6
MAVLAVYKGFAIGDVVWDKEFGDVVIIGIDMYNRVIVTDKDVVGFDVLNLFLEKR